LVDRIELREIDRRTLGVEGARVREEGNSSGMLLPCVERDEIEEASSSSFEPNQLEVEVLFLRGRGGRCLPGISVLNLL
jgi:hypothetical protein